MSNPHFLRTGKIEDADAAGTNSNFIDLRPSTSSPRAQPRALAQGTQPDPKDLRAAEVFGDLTPETIANQAAFDEWKRQQNVFWVDDSLLADDHFEPYKKAAPKDSPRRYEPHHRTRNEHSSHTRRNELGAKSRVRGPNEYRSQNRVTVMGPQNEPSSSNRGIDRTVDRQLSSSRSMPMLNGGSLGSSFIFPSTRPNRPSEDTKPKLSAIAASPQARGAPPCGSENTSHRRISSMASILSFGRHKDDAEKAEKAKEKEENKRLEKAAKEQKEKEEKERKERFKDYTQRELKRAKDLEAARKKRVEDAMEIEERRELERQIAGGEVVLGSREQRDGGYGVEDRERDRVRRQRGGGVAYLGR
ncbi:Protein of unknown function [Pyronema omphalodes CBS 100304]|uniref:Uncharacterized protein n=1 Tax=Pyronema omphalodes (strain CBS 100304) TaxID=1076935 RepID=U4LG72_PYROM|nr:Protein of unknown function [Pyronema omphalodes CBS 100304]